MAKYLFVYHGGGMAATEQERNESMARWGAWAQELGSAVVDFGAPVGATQTVGDGNGASPASGYSLISADSLDAAAQLAQGCPILAGGGSVEVAELMEM
jgi:hypothetical protein